MAIPTYLDVLNEARLLRDEATQDSLMQAETVLGQGMAKYPYALPLGDELVLVLKKRGEIDQAITLLHKLKQQFNYIGEETLCRWGSLLRLRANKSWKDGNVQAAIQQFAESEQYYAKAYEQHRGFYPRINELTNQWVRASLLSEPGQVATLMRDVQTNAEAMLHDQTVWVHRNPDDAIWAPATRGEAYILLQRWPEAEQAYREAIALANGKKFYHDSMHSQIRDVLIPAFDLLGLPFEGALAHHEAFFKIP